MANTRQIEFITGVETATQPAAQDPVNDEDLITLGYSNKNYQQGKQSVSDITELRSIDSADCSNGDMIFIRGSEYEYWFDSSSSAADNSPFIIQPDDLPANGRWILFNFDKSYTEQDAVNWDGVSTSAVYTPTNIPDCRFAVWQFLDNSNNFERIMAKITATATQVTVTVDTPLPAGTYTLKGVA